MAILIHDKKESLIPVIPLRDGVIFPHTESVLTFGRPKSLSAIENAFAKDRTVLFVLQKHPHDNDPGPDSIFTTGSVSHIDRMLRTDGEINALVKGIYRAEIVALEQSDPYLLAKIVEREESIEDSDEIMALCKHLTNEFRKLMNLGKPADFLTFMNVMSENSPSQLSHQIASILDIKAEEKQELLETDDVRIRIEKIAEYLAKEVRILELERRIASKTNERFEKGAKETILRERIRTMEKELGDAADGGGEIKELYHKIKKAKMPQEVEEKAHKELKKLSQMTQFNPEAGYIRNYLDWLVSIPWSMQSKNNIDIKKAEEILDKDHYGLKKMKERIVEYLAVHKLAGKMKGPILCFVGPPGVGKTSLGKSIAKSLGRKFVRVSLGGIRDEAEIRGHRRTYVGALPGRIIQGIKDAKTRNPVFMLDEIDKVGTDFRGDPSSALLEALDPEQNNAFSDHYLEVPFDLSDVLFVTTANILDTIPPALRDRLEVIPFPGYTGDEKFHIARGFLINKQREAHGLKEDNVEITDSAVHHIIGRYTKEAGVRSLEREIAAVFRKIAKLVAEGNKQKIVVTLQTVAKYLGPAKFSATLAEKKDEAGMSTGLAYTEAGGDILFIEVALMPGKGNLLLTGQLGEVMKESCQAAMSYVRARAKQLGLSDKFYQKIDVHVHVPEGAVPKDGPSAGSAIATALVSALTKIPVDRKIGMTGEITLRGRVLEIGGVKEKVIAAHRAGLKMVVMPKENKKDLEDIPEKVLKDLKFVFVSHIDDVLKVALKKPLPGEYRSQEPVETPRPVLYANAPKPAD